MTTVERVHAYRRILRELAASSKQPRRLRSPIIARTLRDAIAGTSTTKPIAQQDVDNIHTFLRAQRLHETLVARYNPGGDLSETERIKATARRVGLDVPDDFDPLAPGELFRIKGGKKGGDGSS